MKKNIGLLLVVLFVFACIPVTVFAKNGFYANEEVNLKKAIDVTSFVAGNSVDVKSDINGMAFVAGNDVNISSTQDYLFAAGNTVSLENATSKDIFAAGSTIHMDGISARDVFAAADKVTLESSMTRNAYLSGTTVVVNSTVEGNVKISAENIKIGKDAYIGGTLTYPENAKIKISDGATVNKQKAYKVDVKVEEKSTYEVIVGVITDFIKTVCAMLVVALLMLLANKKFFVGLDKEKRTFEVIAKRFGIGFAVLFLAPIVMIILLFTGIGTPLSLICISIYCMLFYLSVIPTSYYFGKWILADKIKNDYLLLALSIVVMYVVMKIPYIGGLVMFLSLCIGIGFFINTMYNAVSNKVSKK